ncbi:dienelactone hydrolase family protein [Janthinobacterium agaricidamnosum]|uniref:dienelactone hydrolase family protein n=1 Tax=Janthinobacterium agaricidamnosum TaxID=55508 RepID=UPI000ACF9FEB|nr:CocE/NonD family hydrolase [Janthinobacterium agaricidamnosum]
MPAASLALDARVNEQIIMVPASQGRVALETTLFRPNGDGPFPLLIINHGKQAGDPHAQRRDRFIYMATSFVRRGYAVLVPMRTGFAQSSGTYVGHGCDMTANGNAQADDIVDVVNYARRQPWADGERIVVAGQSYGGLAAVALAARPVPGVRGVLNFAGGLRDDDHGCDWKSALAKAYANYGAHNRIPSLWLYGANDSYFAPQLVQRMYRSFTGSGGGASLYAYGPYKNDAHVMLASRDGEAVWRAPTERFLQVIGMPTADIYPVPDTPAPPKTNFAPLDDIAAVPFLPDRGRDAYRDFLARRTPRAFAVSPSGAWGWAEEGEEPDSRAVAACQARSSQPCRLYSVDDDVVWPENSANHTAVGRTE